jgi:hypothetical protein
MAVVVGQPSLGSFNCFSFCSEEAVADQMGFQQDIIN